MNTKKAKMKKEHSSIEWLVSHFDEYGIDYGLFLNIINKAKKIHKKEIIEAYFSAKSESGLSASDSEIYYNNGEQYYNEKYSQ